MATIYLHIGAPKTATSTLQLVLAKNYKRLLRQGVLYPKQLRHGDAHHLLVCDLIKKYRGHAMADFWYGGKPRGEAWSSLLSEMESNSKNLKSVIISSELFFGQTHDVMPILKDVKEQLKGHEIKVVTYLRRQDQMYSSFYNQDVKGVRQWAASADEFYNTHQIFQKNYVEIMESWAEVFGLDNIILRPFEEGQLEGGDIVKDFCSLVGVEGLSSGGVCENDALGINQLYLKRCMNAIGFEKSDNDEVVNLLSEILPEEPIKNILYINRGKYGQYRKEWSLVNLQLETQFLGGRRLFEKPILSPGELAIFTINHDQLICFVGKVLSRLRKKNLGKFAPLFSRALLLVLAEQGLWSCVGMDDREFLVRAC